jgi:hypothetical protein
LILQDLHHHLMRTQWIGTSSNGGHESSLIIFDFFFYIPKQAL